MEEAVMVLVVVVSGWDLELVARIVRLFIFRRYCATRDALPDRFALLIEMTPNTLRFGSRAGTHRSLIINHYSHYICLIRFDSLR